MRSWSAVLLIALSASAPATWADPAAPAPVQVGWTGVQGLTAYETDGAAVVCPHRPDAHVLRVLGVDEGSPAARAGIAAGEWVAALDGRPVEGEIEARRALLAAVPGTPLELTLVRAAGTVAVPVVPEARSLRDLALARLEAATLWICSQQRRNGGWNNPDARGQIKPATQVGSLALYALASVPATGSAPRYEHVVRAARDRATEFVLAYQAPDGGIDQKEAPRYRVFSSSFAILALLQLDRERNRPRILKLRDFLQRAQLLPGLELPEDHYAVGGWNYYEDFQINNLKVEMTTTAWAVDALAEARGLDGADFADTWRRAEKFLAGCWNSPAQGATPGPWADGGFITHPKHSKGGEREIDVDVYQFRSYGSATADALRAFVRLGFGADDPRVASARDWLGRNYAVTRNPGFPEHAPVAYDQGIFYYYLLSLARGLDVAGIHRLPGEAPDAPERDWRRDLCLEMIARQEANGSWKNRVPIMSEDEPVIATALGILALHHAVRSMP